MSKKRSNIWLHFEEIEDKLKAKCTYCGKLLTTKNGNIGNLHRHLKNKHVGMTLERQSSSQENQLAPCSSGDGVDGSLDSDACNADTSTKGNPVCTVLIFLFS